MLCLDVEKRKNTVCGFVTPLEGSEADSHRKPEVSDLCHSGLYLQVKAGVLFQLHIIRNTVIKTAFLCYVNRRSY